MTRTLLALFLVCGTSIFAASPSYQNFNTNQFGTASYMVTVKSGAILTNTIISGTLTVTNTGAGYIEVFDGSGNAVITLNGTNSVIIGNSMGSNLVFHGSVAMPSATNSLKLVNDYATINTGTDVDITNVFGQVSGEYRWVSLWASNSAATAITVRYTGPGRPIGSNSTNSLSVAAGKFGLLSFSCRGTAWTNYATAAEQ